MANMVGQVLESHKIIFQEYEVPPEGLNHNRALHIIVQFEEKFIARTGPTWFDVEFQVLDIPASYNLLLGRPWIHVAGAMPSTLHQAMKFEWNCQEADTIWGTIEKEALPKLKNLDEDMECSAIIEEEEEEGLTIQIVKKGAIRRNWTATPSRAHRVPSQAEALKVQTRHELENEGGSYQVDQSQISQIQEGHRSLTDLRKFFDRLRRYNLKLNPTKCAFGVRIGKLLGFIVSRRRIELDPSKFKAIQELQPPNSKKDVMSFLGNLNYISCFKAQSAVICEPIFKMLKNDAETSCTEDCQKTFDKIKEYLSTLPILVPPEPGRPLLLYLSVFDGAFGCVLGQHDETGRKEQAIKKFTPYESRYSLLEHTCFALTWTAQQLRHYFCGYTTYLISRMDLLKYIFQKSMPNGKLAKWKIILSELDIVYVTQKAVKGQALADHLAVNPVGGAYEPLKIYFPDEEVSFVGEDINEAYDGWRMFLDGAANFKGVVIGAVLVSEMGQHYPVSSKLRFPCTNNMEKYEACILGLNMVVDMKIQELLVIGDSNLLVYQVQGEWATKNSKILPYLHHVQEVRKKFTKIEFRHVPRIQNEFSDALATLLSMIQHPDKNYIDPISVRIYNQPAYCDHVKEEIDGKPWFHEIKERTPDLGLLRCVDAKEASKLLEDVYVGTCSLHMNGFVLAKKILRAGYFLITMETDCI
ncbi:uncharacterized protein [Nicotiana sylvestris]|uniref:uncharacterized protein n=1 Tax=Nicotiana sylvestris TaxID=4096 RepID=UPI00388C8347